MLVNVSRCGELTASRASAILASNLKAIQQELNFMIKLSLQSLSYRDTFRLG